MPLKKKKTHKKQSQSNETQLLFNTFISKQKSASSAFRPFASGKQDLYMVCYHYFAL